MNTNTPSVYQKKILDFIQDKIECGDYSFESLCDDDKEKLTVLFIDSFEEEAYTVLIEGEETHNVIKHLKSFLMTADMDSGYLLLNSLKKNAIQSCCSTLDFMFEELTNKFNNERNRENGLKPFTDNINGEISWKRSA